MCGIGYIPQYCRVWAVGRRQDAPIRRVSFGSAGLAMFHRKTRWSQSPVTRMFPCGENARASTLLWLAVMVLMCLGRAGLVTSHNITVLSQLAVARTCPLGEKTTVRTVL